MGEVKQTVVILDLISSDIKSDRSFPDFGMKPTNRKLLKSNPDKVNATMTLDGPGIDSMFILLLTNVDTNSEPGSAIRGVPASDNKAIFLPSVSRF